MSQLEQLQIIAKKMFRGKLRGEKRSRKLGQSVEFHDFRQYMPGDDIRRIDWNLYGRIERYFVKLFVEEEDLTLYLLVDSSKSMSFGTPPKFDYARRLAAALAYISLSNLERVSVAVFDTDLGVIQRPTRGRSKFVHLFKILEAQKADGKTSLVQAVAEFLALKQAPGVVAIISDFLFPFPARALSGLVGRGNQVALIQVLLPEEIKPELSGDLELLDSESGERVEVSMGSSVFKMYVERLAELQSELSRWAARTSSDYVLIPSGRDLTKAVLGDLRNRVIR
ncbi:MAG: DUF58 domain-containing protein [bacterium]